MNDVENIMESFRALCDAYLIKPVVASQVAQKLKELELIEEQA